MLSSNCNLLSGRLAHVKTLMWCDDSQSDDMFDQAMFCSYDEAGRVAEHTVEDDGGRKGRVVYAYDKNSNVTRIDYPAGTSSGAVYLYGSAAVSDDDKIDRISRDTTTILDDVLWNPFGPVTEYLQSNGSAFLIIWVDFAHNLAYRVTDVNLIAGTFFSTVMLGMDFAEDVRGRYTQRDLWTMGEALGSLRDSFYLYDDLSRVTCRRTTSGTTCPSSGTTLGENISYNNSGDRSSIILRNGVYTDVTFTATYVTASDELD